MRRLLAVYRISDPLPPLTFKNAREKRRESNLCSAAEADLLRVYMMRPGKGSLWGEGEGSTHPKHSSPRCALPITYSRLPIPFPTLEPLLA